MSAAASANTSIIIGAIALTWAAFGAGCEEQKSPQPSRPTAQDVEDIIYANVFAEGDLLVVRDTLLRNWSVLPMHTPWNVRCVLGLTVIFGLSGETSTEVRITYRSLAADHCRELALVAGETITGIAGGQPRYPRRAGGNRARLWPLE